MSRQSFLRCSSCPLPLVLLLGTSEKSLAPRSCCPPFRNSYTLIRSLPNLLFSGLSRPGNIFRFKDSIKGMSLEAKTDFI